MLKFILKRLLMLIPIIIGISFICFVIMSFTPGDPARIILGDRAPNEAVAQLRQEMGLNDPMIVQYGRYMLHAFQGDFGRSYLTQEPVLNAVFTRFPVTLYLTLFATVVSVGLGIPIGIVSATKKYSIFDRASMIFVLVAISMPSFWLGLLLILLFALQLHWLPSGGYTSLISLILPSLCLGIGMSAVIARMTRTSLLEEMSKDYVKTAEAKGMTRNAAILKHALKNSMVPVITVIGMSMAGLLAGSVLAETVFSLPGVGQLMLSAINHKDMPVVLASVILMAVAFCIANLIVDIIHAFIDPRVKSEYI